MPIKPPRLAPGDVVRVVSLSSPVEAEAQGRLETGVQALESLGLRVQIPEDVYRRYRYSAGTATDRARALSEAWLDPEVRMVLMSQGGQTANSVLDLLDMAAMARNPKVFMGMSDGTTVLTALHARTGLVTFHGPDLAFGFGRPMQQPVLDQIRRVLVEAEPAALAAAPLIVRRDGRATGPLLGGHLNILLATVLAGYEPPFDGAVLFLEGTNRIDELDRQFTILRLRGVFERVAALVLGHFARPPLRDESDDIEVHEVALEACGARPIPVIEVRQLGHHVDNVVLPVGVPALIDTDDGVFRLLEPAVY